MNLKTNRSNKQISFTKEQLELIQESLDISIDGDICIPKKVLFESIQEHQSLEMEQYQFEHLLTEAIRSDKIKGYEIRQGRGGGVCKAGVFKERDSRRKSRVTVTLNNKTYTVPESKRKLLSAIVGTGKEAEAGQGNVFVNNRLYLLPDQLNTLDLLEELLKSGK